MNMSLTALQQEIIEVLKSFHTRPRPVSLPRITQGVTLTKHASRVRLGLEDLVKKDMVMIVNGEYLYLNNENQAAG